MKSNLARLIVADLHNSRRTAALGLICYVVLALAIAWVGRHRLNPDIIAYVQIARHYLHGEFDLAINSWWSPVYSLLIIPGLLLGVEPVLWAMIMHIPAGVGLALATSAIVREFQGPQGTLAGFILALLAALVMATGPVEPDLWHACVLMWYFVLATRLLKGGGLSLAFVTGVVGGIAYLIKAYSLPFVIVHLAITCGLKVLGNVGASIRSWAAQLAIALLAVFIISGPWIWLISRKDGEFTINSAGKYWTVTQPINPSETPLCARLYNLRPGRMSVVENLRELPIHWRPAPPFGGLRTLHDQLHTVVQNAQKVSLSFTRIDGLGLAKAALLISLFCLFPLGEAIRDPARLRTLWALASVVLYASGYVLVFFTDRYLWPVWGLVIAICVVGPEAAIRSLAPNAAVPANASALQDRLRGWHRAGLLALAALLFINVGTTIVRQTIGKPAQFAHRLNRAAKSLPKGLTLVAPDWGSGLSAAYWSNGVFLGSVSGTTPDAIAEELRPFGRVTLLIVKERELAEKLAASPHFKKIELSDPFIVAFDFVP